MDHAAALAEENRLLGELAGAADPSTPVPTCPDWTLRQLLTHLGRGHRWAATIVRERSAAYVDIRTVPDGRPPEDPAELTGWLAGSVQALLDAAAGAGTDEQVWSFVGPQAPSWWVRRRLSEAVVHRADAALALGEPFTVDAGVAADMVSEFLTLLVARPADPPLLAEGVSMHLHATDADLGATGEWMIADGSWEHGHAKGTVAVRGAAADLLLLLMRRLPAGDDRVQVLGDGAVLEGWLERTAF